METGKLETKKERYDRRHKRYLKERAEGKNSAYHKDKNGNKVKSKRKPRIKVADLPPEELERYREARHREYLKAKEAGKSWTYIRKVHPISDEERERRRLNSERWRAEHPERVKENMRRWRAEHGEEEKRSWQEYRRNNKKLAIEYLGGKCVKCGGVFHPDVYDFHHKDENEKDICVAKLLNRKFAGITAELDKCVLLCANCHRIEHAQY